MKKLLLKRKKANQSSLEIYHRGKNQEPRLQKSIKIGREKHEYFGNTKLHSGRVKKKTALS